MAPKFAGSYVSRASYLLSHRLVSSPPPRLLQCGSLLQTPTMATEDARYRQSTQYRLWSFSPSQLASMREKTNELARRNISDRLAANSTNNSEPTSTANTPDPDGGPSTPSTPEFLTPTEEDLLLRYTTTELLRAGDYGNHLTEVKSTAAVFLRRFYIANSIMTYPPKDMILVALFFANKVEGHFLNVDK